MAILQLLLLILLAGLVAAGLAVWHIWRRIHRAVDQLNRQMGGARQDGAARQRATRATRTTRTDSGDTITDTRTPEQAGQKIFAKDEGEYVDFVEKG